MKKTAFSRRLLAVLLVAAMCLSVIPAMVFAAESKTDVINQDFTGISGTSYKDFSGTGSSGTTYAGQCAGDKGSVQLRSKNSNSGIVVTTSAGKAKTIEVEWNAGTADGRTLDVYGKNDPYTSAEDLYDANKQGTIIGSIVMGTSTKLDISGDYAYIGLRSQSGAMYLNSISITWNVAGGTVEPGPSEDPVDPVDPVDPPADTVEPLTTIAAALKGNKGDAVKLSGRVSFITGKSIYIQDDNGENAICVRMSTDDQADRVKLGDLLSVDATLADFKGTIQVSITKDEQFTVSTPTEAMHTHTVTLATLGTAPINTYLTISDELTVKEIKEVMKKDGKTVDHIEVTLTDGTTDILVYKAVIADTLKVGDKVLFSGVRNEYEGANQLRNTLATEIKVVGAGTVEPEPSDEPKPTEKPEPTEKPAETKGDTFVLGTEVKDGDKVILVNIASNMAINAKTIDANGKAYLSGTKVTPQSSKITTADANIVWTVKVVDGGYKLVNAKGETISCESGLAYGDKDNVWAFEFDGKTLKIKSTTGTGKSGDPKYIEWFEKYSEFSTYYLKNSEGKDNDPALFAMNVYVLDPDATPVAPSGNPGTADNAQLVLAGVVMVMAVAAAAAVVTQRKKSF